MKRNILSFLIVICAVMNMIACSDNTDDTFHVSPTAIVGKTYDTSEFKVRFLNKDSVQIQVDDKYRAPRSSVAKYLLKGDSIFIMNIYGEYSDNKQKVQPYFLSFKGLFERDDKFTATYALVGRNHNFYIAGTSAFWNLDERNKK